MSVDLSELKNAGYPHTYEHPKCSSILLTDRPAGLSAIRNSKIQAVIWQRTLSEVLKSAIEARSNAAILCKMFDQFAGRDKVKTPFKFGTLRGLRERNHFFSGSLQTAMGMELYGDMSMLAHNFALAVDTKKLDGRLSIRHPRLEIPDEHRDLFRPHMDHGHEFRMHIAYMGGGMLYLAQRFNHGDGRCVRQKHDQGALQMEQLGTGDVIVFRGAPRVVEMGTPSPGLMHCEKSNPGAQRLAYILTKTYSM